MASPHVKQLQQQQHYQRGLSRTASPTMRQTMTTTSASAASSSSKPDAITLSDDDDDDPDSVELLSLMASGKKSLDLFM